MLYETAARAQEVLNLDLADLDPADRRVRVTRKGGDLDVVHCVTGTARPLPHLLRERTSGALFLSTRPYAAGRAPALSDVDAVSGLARLSYRQAVAVFKEASGGRTLHQLRHSALAHLAEANVSLPLLMAKSRHASRRSLQRSAGPGVAAVAILTAQDGYRRRWLLFVVDADVNDPPKH